MNEMQLNNRNLVNNIFTYWDIINSLHIYESAKTIKLNEHIEYSLSNILEEYDIHEIQRFEVAKRIEMENFINEYINNLTCEERSEKNLTQENVFKLASYIVGCGSTMFEFVKDNPSLIYKLIDNVNFCFEDTLDEAIYHLTIAE